MSILTLQDIHKDFGEGDVLRGISLSAEQGEFMTLLGPSGCGKTTLLRIIAGLESPRTGSVWLNGRDVTALPPEKRNVNTVFQNYALFPHMNVFNNIAYGLKLRGLNRGDIRKKVGEMLALVQLEGFERRMPAQLSGGQRQRVAIARAVVLEPSILLLDEPLGALDLQLRRAMQLELKRIQTQLDIAFVYITHDQEEALNMSDRIAVMREGRIEQYGTPEEIYEHPKTRFAAGFIGQTNLLEATVVERAEGGRLKVRYGQTVLPAFGQATVGSRVALCLRMERVRYGSQPQGSIALPGRLVERQYAGGSLRSTIALTDGRQLVAIGQDEFGGTIGEETFVWWDPKLVPVVPEEAVS
ncbi:MAG TPA: ABC transporter ATP-binding protein [Clostridia bacterium]|nr:ABC transporter ATP-binding protein [Clostridia bacterium]